MAADGYFCVRCTTIGESFYTMGMQQLMEELDPDTNAKRAAEMMIEWQEAEANFSKIDEGDELEFDDVAEIQSDVRSGYRMSMRYGFLTITEFEDEFSVPVKSITSLKVSTRWSEDGLRKLKGVAFKLSQGDEYRFRVLEQFHETADRKRTSKMKHADRLRQKQPDETLEKLLKQSAAEHPAAFVGGEPCRLRLHRFCFPRQDFI